MGNPLKDFHEDLVIAVAGVTFSDPFETGALGFTEVEGTLNITTIDGALTTIDVVPQYSYDKIVWFDQVPSMVYAQITQAGGVSAESLDHHFTGLYFRYKYTVTGASADIKGTMDAVAKG